MSNTYKLNVSDEIQFDVRFSLNDNGAEPEFGFRATARRVKQTELEGLTLGDFLRGRAQLRMTAWLGEKAPLTLIDSATPDAPATPAPAGAEALEALYELAPSMPGVVFAAFLVANGAKGKAGNSAG